jgi:hypothetical protein
VIKEYELVVLGRGLAGHGVLNSYIDKYATQIPDVLWIGKNPFKRDNLGCSISSTAMLARQGIVKGISPLGDLLVDSYVSAIKFIELNKPDGVEKTIRYHIGHDDESTLKLVKRFGNQLTTNSFFNNNYRLIEEMCYLFEPDVYLNWWTQKISNDVTIQDSFVIDIRKENNDWLVYFNDSYIRTKKLVLATGALGESFFSKTKKKATVVPGHYLYWENIIKDKSFVITIDGHNLMYRKESKTMMLSGTSVKDGSLSKKSEIYQYLELFKKYTPEHVPSTYPELRMGMRQKGKKRTPYYEEIDVNLFQVDSLYKNGYSFCHEIGKSLALKL